LSSEQYGRQQMARNPAARKAAKAIRRKEVVAAKRSAEAAVNSLAGQVRQAAGLPILECLVSDGLFDNGMGTVTLMRGASRSYQHVGVFMLDTFCLGVKGTFFRALDGREAEQVLDGLHRADSVSTIPPAEARKLLHDLVAWAEENGFPPDKDYARIEPLFGDVVSAATDYTPRFGKDGRVLYIPGPTESASEVRRRMQIVRSRFGDAAADAGVLALAGALAGEIEDDEC
jgi:hypothetical protein